MSKPPVDVLVTQHQTVNLGLRVDDRTTVCTNLLPSEARELAKTLVEAADKAESVTEPLQVLRHRRFGLIVVQPKEKSRGMFSWPVVGEVSRADWSDLMVQKTYDDLGHYIGKAFVAGPNKGRTIKGFGLNAYVPGVVVHLDNGSIASLNDLPLVETLETEIAE